jgi:hypothetical protein
VPGVKVGDGLGYHYNTQSKDDDHGDCGSKCAEADAPFFYPQNLLPLVTVFFQIVRHVQFLVV